MDRKYSWSRLKVRTEVDNVKLIESVPWDIECLMTENGMQMTHYALHKSRLNRERQKQNRKIIANPNVRKERIKENEGRTSMM